MHVFETRIRLDHTDAAGVVFFARYFVLAHRAYEDLLDRLEQPFPADLGAAPVLFPIVHAESDYRSMLRLGETVRIEVTVDEVKSRSFALGYRFLDTAGTEAAALRTVHVAVDKATGRSTRLPDTLAAALRTQQA